MPCAAARQHRLRVQTAALRQRAGDDSRRPMFAASVRKPSVAPVSSRQRLRQRVQLRRLRMLLREIAEEDAFALARGEARGDRLRRRAEALDPGKRRRRRLARRCGRGRHDDLRQQRAACADGATIALCADRDQQIVVGRMQQRDLRALLRRLAQPLREQRMILAQEAADHQHAVERGELGDRHAEPGRAGRRIAIAAEIAIGANGNRRCRCRGRASASARDAAPRASNAATPARRWPRAAMLVAHALELRARRTRARSASRSRTSSPSRRIIGASGGRGEFSPS